MENVCIVGYGAIGPIHARALSKTDNARFYAVCDIDLKAIECAKKEYDVIAYANFERMLADDNIKSVHICTPHYLHFDMIKRTLEKGKKVVCEKPVAMTKFEFDSLLALPNAKNVCVVMQNRLNPCVEQFKTIIDKKKLGDIIAAKAILTWFRDIDYYKTGSWRGKIETEGGGVLINQAVHTLDFFSYLIGNVETVQGTVANFSLPSIEIEDAVTAYLKFESGVRGIFFATNAYGENTPAEFEAIFEKGRLSYRNNSLYLDNELIKEDTLPEEGKAYWGKSHEKLIENFYDYNKFFTPYDVENTMNTLFAIYDSANNGSVEKVVRAN